MEHSTQPPERAHEVARRGVLRCMAWGGTGLVWSLAGGAPGAVGLDRALAATPARSFTFVQVSDSHLGFAKPANPDSRATFREAIAKINALPEKPDFIIHTGDVSQLSRPEEFDDADQILRETRLQAFFVPGEHDMLDDGAGKAFSDRYGKTALPGGWYSFDHRGVHFVALVNVANLKAGGAGSLGADQLAWLRRDLAGRPSSQPLVVFAHIPLWSIYPDWGWGTDDAAQALAEMARFGSVTVLNGHIHQVMQKTEGRVSFHTAASTAFPQPAPGAAASPGPLNVPAERLRRTLGIRQVRVVRGDQPLAVVDQPLSA